MDDKKMIEDLVKMLDSGMTLYDGIEMLAAEETDEDRLYGTILRGMQSTGSLYEALRQDSSWPQYMVQMVGIGEETGDLQGMLDKTADYYDDEVETATQSLLSLMEPLIMIVLAVFVVILVLAIFLPMLNMTSAYDQYL